MNYFEKSNPLFLYTYTLILSIVEDFIILFLIFNDELFFILTLFYFMSAIIYL